MKLVFAIALTHLLVFKSFAQVSPPINSGELLATGSDLYDSGQYKKALELYEQIDRSDTNYVRALYEKALTYEADSQFQKSLQISEEALKLKEQREVEPEIYNTYGNTLSDIHEKEKAIKIFDEGIRKYPAYTLLYLNKGLALYQMEKYKEAEAVFKQTLMINPFQYSAHYYLGLCAINEGRVLPSFLSFVGYLLVNPEGKYSNRCVNILASIANAKDEILEYKKKGEEPDENFSGPEEILLSKIALDKGYKLKMSYDDVIFRQIQVILEKLEYKDDDADFWMQYYVPFLKKVYDQGQFENCMFWCFENVQLKEIQDYNKKNKKEIEHFVNQTSEYFTKIRSTNFLPYKGRDTVRVKYYFSDGKLASRGEMSADEKNNLGVWTYYYSSGNISATGQYENAQRTGTWKFYYFNGALKAIENYRNGKLEGRALGYNEYGILVTDQTFTNDLHDGIKRRYYMTGNLFSVSPYKNGKLDGEYLEYFQNGQLSQSVQYENDNFNGAYSDYYQSGQLKETGNYVKGKLEGVNKEYYENGQLSAIGNFKNNARDQEWRYFYDDGKIKTRQFFADSKQEGVEEYYYEDSVLHTRYLYKKGLLNGETVSYDKDQKMYAKYQFTNGILQSVSYFDKSGKTISSSAKINNRMDMEVFEPEGYKSIHRPLDKSDNIDGTEITYFQNGKISDATEYVKGEKNGSSIQYYLNGNKRSEATMKDGKQTGAVINYFSNGKIESKGWAVDGKGVGIWSNYNELGQLVSSRYLLDGEDNGFTLDYYSNGVVSNEKKYNSNHILEMRQYDTTGKLLVNDSFPQFTGKFLLLFPNGRKMQEGNYTNGLFDGPFTEYYPDGSVKFRRFYKKGIADSVYVGYYFHNIRQTEGQYKAGQRTGVWKYYYENGNVRSVDSLAFDQQNGLSTEFSKENKKIFEGTYKHDELDGKISRMDPDGNLINILRFDEGVVLGYTYSDPNGNLVPEIKTNNGKLTVYSFFKNGLPSRHYNILYNKADGADTLFYPNGKIRRLDSLNNGDYAGSFKEFYANGSPSVICNYLADHLHNKYFEYNDKGVLIKEINYYLGARHGESKYYNDKGVLQETLFYYDDILLSVKK